MKRMYINPSVEMGEIGVGIVCTSPTKSPDSNLNGGDGFQVAPARKLYV